MTDLREKVARAIHARRQTTSGGGNYDGMVQMAKQCLLDEADAAIRVCREHFAGVAERLYTKDPSDLNYEWHACQEVATAIREDGK